LTPGRHAELLSFFAEQALVRSVELPPILETTPASGGANLGKFSVAEPAAGVDYPTIAIIDGGVSVAPLGKWRVGDAGLVPTDDRDEVHGTFIAGLVSAGSSLNPALSSSIEPAGCKFYDLDLFPRRDLRHTYYSDLEELFDVLDEKVKVAKRDHGVRVFNLSFSIGHRPSRLAYSLAADRLDRIARTNDVVFVVAAGNLVSSSRPPWPEKASSCSPLDPGSTTGSRVDIIVDKLLFVLLRDGLTEGQLAAQFPFVSMRSDLTKTQRPHKKRTDATNEKLAFDGLRFCLFPSYSSECKCSGDTTAKARKRVVNQLSLGS